MVFPDDEDGRVLASIAATGMDLTKPTTIEFAIASSNETKCNAIAQVLLNLGFEPVVYYDEGEPDYREGDAPEFGPSWTVYVPVHCIPSYENVVQLQAKLGNEVEGLGGVIDGWELKLAR